MHNIGLLVYINFITLNKNMQETSINGNITKSKKCLFALWSQEQTIMIDAKYIGTGSIPMPGKYSPEATHILIEISECVLWFYNNDSLTYAINMR